MHRLLNGVLAGVALAALSVGSANAASVLVDGYKLENGSFGAQTGVHSNSSQTGSSVNAYVNQDGSAVTYSTTTGQLAEFARWRCDPHKGSTPPNRQVPGTDGGRRIQV